MANRVDAAAIKTKALSMGFTLVGIAPIHDNPEGRFYSEWLALGYAGEMHYLERQRAARLQPESLLPGARSVVACALNYNTRYPLTSFDRMRAWVSRYAWGRDYHETLQDKLKELARWIEDNSSGHTKTYVDTGPVNERVFAKYAGIGWFGKNTCIINEKAGSWLFLGCIFTDLSLDFDTAPPDRCGSCTRCLDVCPTNAFAGPYILDSTKCISYTTIELRGDIPEAHREGIGHHLFGCDICQDVCPWNRRAPVSADEVFQPKPGLFWPELEGLLDLTEEEWRKLMKHTPLKRAKLKGVLRNLMVVAGNSGLTELSSRVERFLEHENESVRSHAAWAIRKLKG